MVSQMIVVVAGEQGKDQPPPQLAEICGDVVAVLADAVSQQRVGTSGARREADEAGAGQKGNPPAALPVKPRNHRHPPAPGARPTRLAPDKKGIRRPPSRSN